MKRFIIVLLIFILALASCDTHVPKQTTDVTTAEQTTVCVTETETETEAVPDDDLSRRRPR